MGEVQAPEKELPLAAQIMDKVRKRFRSPMELVVALEKEGIVGPSGGRYDPSSVSSWARGAVAVPGEVLLTAARLADVRVDEYLYPEEAGRTDKKDRERLDKVERGLDELREQLRAEALNLHEELRNLGRIGIGHVSTELDEGQSPT